MGLVSASITIGQAKTGREDSLLHTKKLPPDLARLTSMSHVRLSGENAAMDKREAEKEVSVGLGLWRQMIPVKLFSAEELFVSPTCVALD